MKGEAFGVGKDRKRTEPEGSRVEKYGLLEYLSHYTHLLLVTLPILSGHTFFILMYCSFELTICMN